MSSDCSGHTKTWWYSVPRQLLEAEDMSFDCSGHTKTRGCYSETHIFNQMTCCSERVCAVRAGRMAGGRVVEKEAT